MKIDKETLPTLPEEIIEEILSRLAVKSLLKFRCVSKSWRSLIDSKRFIETHYRNSTNNPNFPHQRFILLPRHDPPTQCSLHNLLNAKPTKPSPYDYPVDCDWGSYHTLGCYNGLVCILDLQRNFIVWNPSTRIVNKLPESTDRSVDVQYPGFGWVESTGEYKVFAAVRDLHRRCYVAEVYSSKTKSWKTLRHWDLPLYCYCYDAGMCVSEKLYWYCSKGVVWLDLKSEVIGTTELPSKMDGGRLSLGVIGGCLSAVLHRYDERGVQVWVMKENGVNESWERVASLPHILELLQRPFSPPLIIGPNGKILVLFQSGYMIYCPQQNVLLRPMILNNVAVFSNYGLRYIESLLSPQVV